MISIAILGYGTVGSGVAEVCRVNSGVIRERVGRSIEIRYILDVRDFPGDPFADRITHDPDVIINDPDISVVVETIGGAGFAYEMTKRALSAGKHVVTSNKELVARHGTELIRIALANQVSYSFEASVGGGIPIIRPLHKCLAANVITRIAGILNGTTNYILTRMEHAGIDFATALAEAQAKGYAELHPEADIEGIDACRKIAILSSICRGEYIDSSRIHTEGITQVTGPDMAYARALGRKIKLLGLYRRLDDQCCDISVAPMMVDRADPVAVADDVFNAIEVEGNALGKAMFYGRGAGRLPTASAVVADVIESALHIDRIPHQVSWQDHGRDILIDHRESLTQVFLRFREDAAAKAAEALAPYGLTRLETLFPDEQAFIAGQNGNLSEGRLEAILQPLAGSLISRIRMYN